MKCSLARFLQIQWVLSPISFISYLNVIMYCLDVIFIYYLQCGNAGKRFPCRVQSNRQLYCRCKRGSLFFSRGLLFFKILHRRDLLSNCMDVSAEQIPYSRRGSYCSHAVTQITIIPTTISCKDPIKHISPCFNLGCIGVVMSNRKKKLDSFI